MLGIHVAQDMLDENGNIFLVLAQRGQVNVKHVQSKVEILPQLAAANGRLGFFVGCR